MDVPAAVTALLNTMVAVDRKNSTEVDITSSSCQMIEAGRTLAASATRDGRRVHVVLLNAPNRFADAAALLDWAFDSWCWPGGGTIGCGGPVTRTALAIETDSD